MAKKRPPTAARKPDEPWKQWPRSADVREWMHALLSLTEYMDKKEELASTAVIVALGELAKIGFPDEALEHVERVDRLLPQTAAMDRSRVVMTGAEIAFNASDLRRMQAYLQRALDLQQFLTRKCDQGYQEQRVYEFRLNRGLLAPADAKSEQDRIEASFQLLMRTATEEVERGDAATAVSKLVEAKGLVASMPEWRRHRASESLAVAFARAGDQQNLQILLDADDSADRRMRINPKTLLDIGHKAKAVARYEDEAREALEELKMASLNAHFPAHELEHSICSLADVGEMELAGLWLGRALEQGRSWDLPAPGAFTSAVFQSLAKAVARVQGKEAALSLVKLAMERAQSDQKSDWRTAAIRANAELLIEFSPPEEAADLARKVLSRKSRSRLLARAFAQSQDWDGLHSVLNSCAKPIDAAELIWWTKFVWRPAT